MENVGENGAIIHSVSSVPVMSSGAEGGHEEEREDGSTKTSKNRRVSFAASSQFLEPINPFDILVPISSSKELSSLYKRSCEKHNTVPIKSIVEHLEAINLDSPVTTVRTEVLNLRHETLSHESCEALEELFKRVKYKAIDLTSCSLDDVSATAIFDMIEYYEACNELDISENSNIKNRGWQSCINMIKRSQALHSLFTRGTPLSDANALALGNALLSSFIYTLKLEHCGLSGRPILCLSGALQKNRILKELCLANNELNHNDAFHIGSVLKNNYHLQLLDISNNDIQDEGFRHIAEALGYQSVHVIRKASSGDSVSSANKFDFGDLTANLNNINNNRQRFCPTPPPPPKINVADDGGGAINNNNNSILQCDKDASVVAAAGVSVPTARSTNDEKFKYTTASLSPISHGYDDTTTNHQLFNARSPERSFSSESLCSETSIESNDSKSSIRLIETKFNNKNGTLERQISNAASMLDSSEKPPTGLQVLILWNNNLSVKCAPSAADMLEATEHLQIINLGQNAIGNEFLVEVKSSLKANKSLTSLGMQATQLTCDGLKTLGDIIQFGGNSTLQRVDLRNNELSVFGLSALSEALKSNKNIIRVDLDEKGMYDGPEYQRWLSTIKEQCAHNENPPEPVEAAKATTTVQRIKRNHLSTRKISLTCSSIKVVPKQLLDPKKSGRSSSPSPVLSPLPSPSRNRFQVSRVSESSSGVSSKLTSSTSPSPSSSSGSPTFFPSNSRFRVVQVPEAPKIEKKPETSQSAPAKMTFLNISDDFEVKKFIDMDSGSSFSSSVESIESFDLVDKSPIIVEPPSNENTLVSTSSSSSEGLTLTTNSPTSELSPKQEKRIRKTSWIQNAMGGGVKSENYPATLDKLMNLFTHPTSIFAKTSPETSLAPEKLTPPPDMGQKENSISGFFNSLGSLMHKKEQPESSSVLQENSAAGKTSPVMILESLPKNVKQELKENISPENTISSENLIQRAPKVVFLVGESSIEMEDDPPADEPECLVMESHSSLGDIARDSMSILKPKTSPETLEDSKET